MRINHDFHIHTNLSLCAAETVTAEHYIKKAKELGIPILSEEDFLKLRQEKEKGEG